jgi:hypothetical protein
VNYTSTDCTVAQLTSTRTNPVLQYSMAEARKGSVTTNTEWPAHSVEPREVEIPTGWKYKSLKLGPITLPWYASPESQLILVSFVCFLCPGKTVQHNIFLRTTDYVKACSMLSTALVVQGSLTKRLMLVMPQTPRSMLLSLLSVSSPAPSPTPSASESLSRSVALDTVSTSAHIYASTLLITSGTWSLPASCLDAVQAFSGPRKVRL